MKRVVEVERVAVTIDEVTLLGPTSFSIARGESLAITGRNGSGKTTLLRVLTGQLRATSGSALVNGASVDERRPAFRRAVSGAIGRPPVARDLTLAEHLGLVSASWGETVESARALAQQHLDRWQLSALSRRFPHELSSGQSHLFTLALATVRPFDVLVLDEPEQRLDPDRLDLVTAVLRDELDRGRTIVFATHSLALTSAIATHTISLGATA